MLARATKIGFRIALWTTTLLVLLACGLMLRLYAAPVDLSFARAEIASQLEKVAPDWTIRYERAQAGWDFADMRPWVRLRDVAAENRKVI